MEERRERPAGGNCSLEDTDIVAESLNDTLPTFIHPLMFVPNVEALCDQKQQQYWLPRCHSMEVIGCYAQTELGHGSNIRALQTTATFMPDTDEFDIHTPSIAATKWWPGTLGRTANHAMVIAQLVIGDKVYGIHNFIVPIRDPNHLPLPGVRVGDIGPKIGFNTMDNGFCSFDHVRIPRGNMAMRHQTVDRDGTYTKTASKEGGKIAYITVMQVRALLTRQSGVALAKAATIATRYSILRRQGFRNGGKGPGEHQVVMVLLLTVVMALVVVFGVALVVLVLVLLLHSLLLVLLIFFKCATAFSHQCTPAVQILDYTIQMHRLLPLVATSYGFHFTGQALISRLRKLERDNIHGKLSGAGDTLKQFHASSSCLKSMCTGVTAAGIEDCRKACGGHGFLQSSGIPEHLGTYLQACTVEGENHMLTQQVTRATTVRERPGCIPGVAVNARPCCYSYVDVSVSRSRCSARTSTSFRNANLLEAALEHRAFRVLRRIEARLAKDVGAGMTPAEAWNRALVEIHRASHAHAYLLVFKSFKAVVDSVGESSEDKQPQQILDSATCYALDLLLLLLGLYWMQNDMGDFVEDGYLSGDQAGWVRDEVVEVLHLVRPMAVSLVDAWDLNDFQLNSALGRFDGRAYEALLETTERNPMNRRDPTEGYVEHLKPVIQGAREARLKGEEAAKGNDGINPRNVPGPGYRSKL
eukprot:jgi/Undpi1/11857/HiC_scaffold_4.g01556.m1